MSASTDVPVAAKRSRRFRLFSRLALLVAVPVLLLAIAAVINAQREYNVAKDGALANAQVMARQAALRLDDNYIEQAKFLDTLGEVARNSFTQGENVDRILQRLYAASPPYVNDLSITALDGRMLGSAHANVADFAGVTLADRAYFKAALATRATVVSEPLQSRTNQRWISVMARAVLDHSGAPIGVVSMSIRIDRFHDLLVPLGLPPGAIMTVLNERGVGVASTVEPIAAIGRDFTKSSSVQRALKEGSFAELVEASDGQPRLTAYALGEKLRWLIEVGLPVEPTLAPARERLKQRLLLLLAALVLGLASAYALVRWIALPIHELTDDAERLGRGDTSVRSAATGFFEIDRLAAAFNVMAQAVQTNQQDLKTSEGRFRSLVLLSSDWYWTQDTEHRFSSHSEGRFGDIALYAEDFRGKARWEMPGAEPVGTTWEAHRAMLAKRETWRDLVVRYTANDGTTQYISSSGEPTYDEQGEFTGYRGVARLMTERYQLEAEHAAVQAALRDSEGRLRATLEFSPNVAVQWYDREGRVRFWNNASSIVFGWTAEEAIGRTLDELGLYTPAQFREFVAALRAVDRDGPQKIPAETPIRRKDGSQGVIVSTLFPISSRSGQELYACMDVDVSLRVQLEKENRERVELFRVTLDTPAVCVALIRRRDNLALLTNRATNETFNVDLARANWDVTAHWERKQDLVEMLKRVQRDGYVRDMEVPVHIPGRSRMWAQLSAHPARYQGDDVLVVTLNDITERKLLEEQRQAALAALRENEGKFRALTALSSDWYWEQDAQLRFTDVGSDDPRWATPMLGKTRWELDGDPVGMTWAEHQAQLERREVFRNLLFRYTIQDGATVWLSVNGEPVFGEDGAFRGYRGTASDVSQRYRLELELQERIELFRTTLDTSPVSTALVRVRDNVVLLANHSAHQTFRVDPSTKTWNVMDHRDRLEDMPEFVRRIKRDGFVRDMEVPVQVAARGRLWMLVSAQPGRLQGEDIMVVTMHDITERKLLEAQRNAAEVALRASEAKFRALTELSSDWYWEQDAQFRFTSYSTEFRTSPTQTFQVLGKTRWEMHGEPMDETWDEHRARLDRHEEFRGKLFRYERLNRPVRYVAISGAPVFDEAGKFAGYRGTSTDVTERVRLESELKERMELLRVTLETTPACIGLITRRDTLILLANRAAYDTFGVTPERSKWLVRENWEREEDRQAFLGTIKRDGHVRDMEVPLLVAGQQRKWMSLSANPARYLNEDVFVVTANDISVRRALEMQRETLLTNLRGANERLRLLSQQVLDAQEAERRKIAHELHDEIGQNLTALKLFAGHMRANVKPEAQPQLEEWITLLDQAIGQVRDLSRLLRPVQLDYMGLSAALRALLDTQARAAGWSVEFEADADLPRIDGRRETVAYRVVQEALANAARHADAASVSLALKHADGQFHLTVSDDGRGFDLAAARTRVEQGRSMGLLGMEERVRLAGGTFRIESAPSEGTRIMVSMPITTQAVTS